MRIPVAKIGLFLLLIIVLPPVFFSAYEVSNLYRNEQMVDSIYTNQLESVIFSINQYSDDVVSGWANDINEIMEDEPDSIQGGIRDFIRKHLSVDFILFTDSSMNVEFYTSQNYRDSIDKFRPIISEIIVDNQLIIKRLEQFLKSNYRKIQPIDIDLHGQSLLLFGLTGRINNRPIIGIILNTRQFIRENLGPKIQSVARESFYISVFDRTDGNEIYSNELIPDEEKTIEHKKSTWLFPDYELGIELKGETIEDLVQARTRFNIIVIIILDIVLLLAAWFVYRAVRQEVKLAQLKSDFVSNVSHEIRTPLAIINMYAETLQMNRIKSEEKKLEYYKVINTETNRLSGIVNKILNFSKIESGKRNYNFESTDLNEILQQIIQNYEHHFKSKQFTCNLDKSDKNLLIKADKEAITDAIINLIDNAIKYSSDKKQIDILTGMDKEFVFVEVKDYGIGIDKKHQQLVFDKFFRVTTGDLAYKSKGSGIGLSIVKHIMDAHQGKITLQSKPGEGSRFRLNFPRQMN